MRSREQDPYRHACFDRPSDGQFELIQAPREEAHERSRGSIEGNGRVRRVRRVLRRIRYGTLAVVFGLGMVLMDARAALADNQYWSAYTYTSGEECVWGHASTNHGSYGTGYHQSNVVSKDHNYSTGENCGVYYSRPAGYLATRFIAQKWNGSAWSDCWDTGWYYSTATADEWYVYASNSPDGPVCGDGDYRTYGFSYMDETGYNNWIGGAIWTGSHHFEGTSSGGK